MRYLSFSRSVVACLGFGIAFFPVNSFGVLRTRQVDKGDDAQSSKFLNDAIEALGSEDRSARYRAMETLLRAGDQSIPFLLELLKSVTPKIEVCPPNSNLPCRIGSRWRTNATKKERAQTNAISLLGQLQAVAAVPPLIQILGEFDSEGSPRYWGEEMIALINIGSRAVPELLDALKLAEEMRQQTPMTNGSFAPHLEIQVRIVNILGHIGDDRALKIFEGLRTTNTSPYFLSYLADAEARIRHKTVEQSDSWEPCDICDIPARIALNSSPGPNFVPRRHIYLLIEPSDFSEQKLGNVFEKLSKRYPDPIFLTITAFSNRESLKQLIKAVETESVIDFADTPEGRTIERHYYERYPPKTGYFRAHYLRSAIDRESFQYSPNPEDKRTIEVILKPRRR